MRQIRDTLHRASQTLNTIDYGPLNKERRANYDNAKGWIKQAEEALEKNDVTLAKSLADRAETIAKQLAGK
jgi:phage shock protein A